MRYILLACVAVLAMAPAAHATVYSYSGALQTDAITTSGIYDITAIGATGGGTYSVSISGGSGAVASGDIYLTAGTMLEIIVGGAGGNGSNYTGGGGGGGSFVYIDTSTPLVIGGGGGGLGYVGSRAGAGSTAPSGGRGAGSQGGAGGPGRAPPPSAGGPGGHGGGKGGYSGGGGGDGNSASGYGGGGGGSFVAASNDSVATINASIVVNTTSILGGNGEVSIAQLSPGPASGVPEPASLLLLASGAAGALFVRRRRARAAD